MQGSPAARVRTIPLLLLCAALALACARARRIESCARCTSRACASIRAPRARCSNLVEDGDSGAHLRIWIGEFEARSIAQALEREPIVRPNSHDLLKNVLERLDGRVQRILVTELRESTFYALIEVELHGRSLRIDARPSDAIAVALRTGAPVLVAESLLATSRRDSRRRRRARDRHARRVAIPRPPSL